MAATSTIGWPEIKTSRVRVTRRRSIRKTARRWSTVLRRGHCRHCRSRSSTANSWSPSRSPRASGSNPDNGTEDAEATASRRVAEPQPNGGSPALRGGPYGPPGLAEQTRFLSEKQDVRRLFYRETEKRRRTDHGIRETQKETPIGFDARRVAAPVAGSSHGHESNSVGRRFVSVAAFGHAVGLLRRPTRRTRGAPFLRSS